MDDNVFGSYGVLRFMRRHEETVVASYPIDDDELTFGSDPSCSVRLYYPTVSPLHAKIIFQERKAFIQVLGVHGIFVDKCRVFPVTATSHTTVPLINNSEIEINKKRFRFGYPPKALRPVLAFTPQPNVSTSARKRVLRLSMIQSAQVFTPRPDPDPRVNLRVLQTPIRLNSSPLKHARQTTPRQVHADQLEEECGTPIRLVEGNRPQVVEEEQDLVILEEVDAPQHISQPNSLNIQSEAEPSGFINPMQSPVQAPQMGGPYPAPAFPLSHSHQLQQFQTPRRRLGRPSLHRAVLIRSAQRAAMRIEMECEQDEEEREVEEHVLPVEEQMEVDEEDQRDQDADVIEEFNEEAYEDGDGEDPGMVPRPTTPVLGWRMGLEAFKSGLQVLRSRSKSPEKNQHAEGDVVEARPSGDDDEYDVHHSIHDDGDHSDQDEELQDAEDEENLGDVPYEREARLESEFGARAVSVSRQFTPQRPERPLAFMTPQVPKANGGLSLADRVRGRISMGSVGRANVARSWRVPVPDPDDSSPSKDTELGQPRVSDLERQAIKERRRSALAQPDTFFGGTIPGSRRSSFGTGTPVAKVAPSLASPSKAWAPIKEDEDETETTSLLEKMKEVVEGMQRRRSVQPEAIGNVPMSNKSEEGDKDAGLQGEVPKNEEAETVPLQTDPRKPARSFPATPHMSDLKHVFSENRAANMPPSYAGVRGLFRAERAANPETPRLDGMREMFNHAREREPNTPAFEGIGDMLATPAEYHSRETTRQSDEIKLESMAETHVRSQSVECPMEKSVVSGHPAKPSSRIAVRTSGARPMRDGRVTPTDAAQFADDEMQEVLLDKPSEHSANAAKGSTVRRTNRRVETEVKQDTAAAPTKLASRARKVITPEITEQAPTQPNPVAPQPRPARRSRAATKSTESTESEPAKPTKPTRKTTTRGTKAGAASEADAEMEAEPTKGGLRRGTRTRSQSVEAPAPAPAKTKRRVGAKFKKAADVTLDPPAEDGGPDPSLGGTDRTEHPEVPPAGTTAKAGTGAVRGRRGKTKVAAAEMEDESAGTDVGTGTLRVARGGKRTPTTNVGTTTGAAAGAASNRATTTTATVAGKGRVVARVGAGASSGKNAARTVGEKENTPERIHVKEEEDEKLQLPSGAVVAAKGGRARKGATAAAVPKALSEPEKDVTAPKARAPRKRAASGKK